MNCVNIAIMLLVLFIAINTSLSFFNSSQKNENWPDPIMNDLVKDLYDCFPHLSQHINSLKIEAGEKSYTTNKKTIKICTRDEDNTYYPKHMLFHVLVHELAHCICDEIGHTPKFYSINNDLQNIAKNKGYLPLDFDPYDYEDYCEVENKPYKMIR